MHRKHESALIAPTTLTLEHVRPDERGGCVNKSGAVQHNTAQHSTAQHSTQRLSEIEIVDGISVKTAT